MAGWTAMDFPDGGAVLDLDVACMHGSAAAKYLPQMIITPVG